MQQGLKVQSTVNYEGAVNLNSAYSETATTGILNRLAMNCDGCGESMNVTHSLNCKGDELPWRGVMLEPVLQGESGAMPGFVADTERVAFDNPIVNGNASSFLSQDWSSITDKAAKEKHDGAAEDHFAFNMLVRRSSINSSTGWHRP
ncbi:hypothetical protein GE061_003915 [Apolygus lucorum]|uniref:Uncharacterized protein n=1 Tax=Apolygus lucorum TaxID=248454 RepID=A0A8S9WZ63_APOLU|nr:hypothetical protein GE061_003915 [Apolygus lucorum]